MTAVSGHLSTRAEEHRQTRAVTPSAGGGRPTGGMRSCGFYNTRYDHGQPKGWRRDDPEIAFPVFEKAQELGVDLVGVHKGVPLGPQPIEHTQTWGMDGAAARFPDLNFVIFHPSNRPPRRALGRPRWPGRPRAPLTAGSGSPATLNF